MGAFAKRAAVFALVGALLGGLAALGWGTGAAFAVPSASPVGLGTASTLNVGTGANNIVQLDGSGALPAVDGSALTGLATTAITSDINQVAHGFAVGEVVRDTGGGFYSLSDASTALNAEVTGIVSAVAGVDDFTITRFGLVSGLAGLGSGQFYFLDPATPGGLTFAAPVPAAGTVNRPVLQALSMTEAFFFGTAARGFTNPGSGSGTTFGVGDMVAANDLSDLNDAATARTNLGLGSAATLTAGTGANNLVQLDGSSALPAVDGSALTGIVAATKSWIMCTLSGDVFPEPAGKIAWDTSTGSGLSLVANQVALTGGKTYRITAHLSVAHSAASGELIASIYDTTNTVDIGKRIYNVPSTYTSNWDTGGTLDAIVTPAGNITIEIRDISDVGTPTVRAAYSTLLIQEL